MSSAVLWSCIYIICIICQNTLVPCILCTLKHITVSPVVSHTWLQGCQKSYAMSHLELEGTNPWVLWVFWELLSWDCAGDCGSRSYFPWLKRTFDGAYGAFSDTFASAVIGVVHWALAKKQQQKSQYSCVFLNLNVQISRNKKCGSPALILSYVSSKSEAQSISVFRKVWLIS